MPVVVGNDDDVGADGIVGRCCCKTCQERGWIDVASGRQCRASERSMVTMTLCFEKVEHVTWTLIKNASFDSTSIRHRIKKLAISENNVTAVI